MQFRSLFAVAILAFSGLTGALPARAEDSITPPADTTPVTPPPADTAPVTPPRFQQLDRLMDRLGQLARQLRRELPDPANDANSLAAANEMGALFEEAHAAAEANNSAMLPSHLREVPEADRPAFIQAYKEALLTIRAKVAELEANLAAGDNATAQATFAAILEMRNVAHDRFDPAPPSP